MGCLGLLRFEEKPAAPIELISGHQIVTIDGVYENLRERSETQSVLSDTKVVDVVQRIQVDEDNE